MSFTAERAVTAWITHEALTQASVPKALYTVANATHVDLYGKTQVVEEVVAESRRFFNSSL